MREEWGDVTSGLYTLIGTLWHARTWPVHGAARNDTVRSTGVCQSCAGVGSCSSSSIGNHGLGV